MTTEPMHLSFLDFLIWHAPGIAATIGLTLCVVLPILIHLNRKGF